MLHRIPSVCFAVLLVFIEVARAEIRPDFLMDSDPEVRILEPIKEYSKRLKPLWLEALSRPEHEMQRMAAETIARAHSIGVPGLSDAVPTLERLLAAESSHPSTRSAAARALIALKATDSAGKLFDISQRHDGDLRQLIEPALADWNFPPIQSVWLKRLDARDTRQRDLVLAIRCLARVHESAALPPLQQMLQDPTRSPDVRLDAADALRLLAHEGLESHAERLLKDARAPSVMDRLCAVRLLARHSSESAQTLLLELTQDSEPAVAAAALRRLNEIDPALVLPLAEACLSNADPHVRQCGADSFIQRPTPARMQSLARLLDDPHPSVRGTIREAFFRLEGTAELSDPIRQSALQVLANSSWRGQEQAALLLAALDHEPAADRLVELLESNRPEVMIASAWGLHKLAVAATLPAMFDKAKRQTEIRDKGDRPGLDKQVAHLMEAFGRLKFAPAEPLMRQYIPKNHKMGELSRSAAIWGLGWMYAGTPNDDLASQFLERLTDYAPVPPEFERVREMSLVSMARMKAVAHTETIRTLQEQSSPHGRMGQLLRWAVVQLTGEVLPDFGPRIISPGLWFLEPLEPLKPVDADVQAP